MTKHKDLYQQAPTPEEIRQRCLEIQAEWTEQERQKRLRVDWRSNEPARVLNVDVQDVKAVAGS